MAFIKYKFIYKDIHSEKQTITESEYKIIEIDLRNKKNWKSFLEGVDRIHAFTDSFHSMEWKVCKKPPKEFLVNEITKLKKEIKDREEKLVKYTRMISYSR